MRFIEKRENAGYPPWSRGTSTGTGQRGLDEWSLGVTPAIG
jgi:hypothetical protein